MAARLMAWLGGAVFVASLVLLALWYFVALDAVPSATDFGALLVDALLVSVFALHHSLFARSWVKRALTFVPPPLELSFYVWVASTLLAGVVLFWRPIGGDVWRASGAIATVLSLVQAAGILLIARSVAGLDALELAGIRQAARQAPRLDRLQIGGPYRFVRHPLYLGWVIAFFGAAHMTGDRLAFATLTSAYLVIAVPWEERALRSSFGDEYARYQSRVRWRIVPYVY